MSSHSDPESIYETKEVNVEQHHVGEEFDPIAYYESNAGRLVMDPREAQVEFGEEVAQRLKLSQDGTKVLWPQPLDDPEDPQNVIAPRKLLHRGSRSDSGRLSVKGFSCSSSH
ncbi:hypothetical protein EIP86_009481 [Pleurotus ostreatoroseus]|nr:hypothetical protein EIP86_009481 [Pleurotus ostreatoroseus]